MFLLCSLFPANAEKKPTAQQNDNPQAKENVFANPEKMPQFPGGEKALKKFLDNNIKYPKDAMEMGISGKVVVMFTISVTGKVESPKVVRSVSPSCDKEALRVVNMFPDFEPGKLNGEPRAMNYIVPVFFHLNDSH